MANTFINTSWVSREGLEIVQPNMVLARSINTDYSSEFGKEGMKVGDTIQVPLPQQFVGRTGANVNIESIQNLTTPVTLTTQYGVDVQVTSKELKLNMQDATRRYVKSAFKNIAAYIDRTVAQTMALTCPNQVGVAGTAFTDGTFADKAKIILDDMEAPLDDERYIVLDTRQESSALAGTRGYFNDQKELARQYRENRMGTSLGFNWAMSQNLGRYAGGTYSGTPVISGANQSGTTLTIGGISAGNTFNQGDRLTIAGVYNTETIGKQSLPSLRQFVVTSPVTASGTTVTLNIFPAITAVGQYQNVSNVPANGAGLCKAR